MDSGEPARALSRIAFTPIGLDGLRHVPLREGLNYWRFLCGGRAFPARDAIEPRAICRLLCNAILLKVIEGGADFEFVIVGDEVTQAYRVPLARRRLSEVAADLPQSAAHWGKIYRRVLTERVPLAWRFSIRLESEAMFSEAETVLLPMGKSDDAVDHLLIFTKRQRAAL